jgi:pimeloyl-ACP methyl ester carboxylesterase
MILRLMSILIAIGGANAAQAQSQARGQTPLVSLVMHEEMIASGAPGLQLYLRNKHRQDHTEFTAGKTVLYVHGSTYPAETAFDLPLDGLSWMEYIAKAGYDVWLVDLCGYGRSDRPKEMDEPAAAHEPLIRTPDAVKDVDSAVRHILKTRAIGKLSLIGWSWGTTIMAMYTAGHNENVVKLVLYAPQWLRTEPSLTDKGGPLGAYRVVSIGDAKERWLKGVALDKREALIPAGWFEQWAKATFETDPWGWQQEPKKLRAPNGTVADSREFWASGKPRYDPSEIKVPTLIVHAEWDADLPGPMSHAVFAKLTNAPWKRFVEIGEGTHTVLMERNRMQLFREVQLFLDESGPQQ